MRVLQLSDLHVDVNSKILGIRRDKLEEEVINYLLNRNEEFDIIFIVGDVSNCMISSIKFLDKIEERLNKKVLFVPGNHDIYRSNFFDINSVNKYDLYKNSNYNLYNNPYKLTDDLCVVGGLGWYDFSFYLESRKDNEAEKSMINYIKEVKQLYWADDSYVNFNKDDREVFKEELEVYRNTFDLLKKENKNIWLLNHFVPYEDFLIIKPGDEVWNTCNSFMGGSSLGRLIDEYENVKYVSFGHTHHRFGKLDFKGKTIVCKPLGYVGEWGTKDFLNELNKSTVIVEL